MEDTPLVTMHFRRKDRPPLSLTICVGDEPLQLAVTFAAAHALPSICIPRLKEQIVFHKETALANLSLNNLENLKYNIDDTNIMVLATSQQPQQAIYSKNDNDQSSQNTVEVTTAQQPQQLNTVPVVDSKNANNDLNSHGATSLQTQQVDVFEDNEKAYVLLREKWLPPYTNDQSAYGNATETFVKHTAEKPLIMRASTPPHSPRQRSLSAPPKLSSDRGSDKQQLMYNRLYNEGQLSKERIDKLRERILMERSQIIRSSSFRETLKRKSSERTKRRSVSNPRSSITSKSPSDAAPLPNQHVFDKLYNSSLNSGLRLKSLKERLEREEQLAIERSSFR